MRKKKFVPILADVPPEGITYINARDASYTFFRTPTAAIYSIVCKENKRELIGLASDDVSARVRNHFKQLRKGTHRNKPLQEDFALHGEQGFTAEILCTFSDAVESLTLTTKWRMYRKALEKERNVRGSYVPKGYNSRVGRRG